MTGSVNRVIVMGNVGRDPEIKTLSGDTRIATLTIATEEAWTDKRSGERQKRTEWHRIVVFNQGIVKVIDSYIKKGAKLHVIGELRTRKWTGRDGEERHTTEIVLPNFGGELTIVSTPKREGESGDGYAPRQATRTDARGTPQYSGGDLDESIPF